MKKFCCFLLLFLLLCGCQRDSSSARKITAEERYLDLVELLQAQEVLRESSNAFDLSGEIVPITEGYRYYVFIDNARIALYDMEVLACEDGVDYTNQMAASVGIFEENEYHMIPNQSNPDKGYVSGLVISGVSQKPEVDLRVLIQWENKDRNNNTRAYYRLHLAVSEEND